MPYLMPLTSAGGRGADDAASRRKNNLHAEHTFRRRTSLPGAVERGRRLFSSSRAFADGALASAMGPRSFPHRPISPRLPTPPTSRATPASAPPFPACAQVAATAPRRFQAKTPFVATRASNAAHNAVAAVRGEKRGFTAGDGRGTATRSAMLPSAPMPRQLPLCFLLSLALWLLVGCSARADDPADWVDVVVAWRNIEPGTTLSPDDIKIRRIATAALPAEHSFRNLTDVVGRAVREPILVNEIVREERLAPPDAGVGINALITPGKRAVALPFDASSGWTSLLIPGQTVDVFWTESAPPEPERARFTTVTVVQGERVLAVGDQMGPVYEKSGLIRVRDYSSVGSADRYVDAGIVTLELTPEDAVRVAEARRSGSVVIAVRAETDITEHHAGPVDVDELLADPNAPPTVQE